MDEIMGTSGELVNRLIQLLNCDALGDGGWYSTSCYAAAFLGGASLRSALPDTGTPTPGSVGEKMREDHDVVSRERYFELIGDRLRELITCGVEEAFLVRSLRDAIGQEFRDSTNVSEADRKRAEFRASIQQAIKDPARISDFRDMAARDDPSAKALSDEEVTQKLREMLELAVLHSIPPDIALENWAACTHWDEHVESLLPDAVFDEWRLRFYQQLRKV